MNQIRSRLADLVRQQRERMNATATGMGGGMGDGALTELIDFGANPGALRMLACLPPGLPRGAPLVVALHGCTQTAAGYAQGSGWGRLAAEGQFAVLLPEQRQANNPNRCFNWFEPGDTRRGQGEVASVHAAILHLIASHGIDPGRVFVTGLSAGGGMASSLLATYPEVFAAGAIIAGLPHGAATSMPEAFEAMGTGRPRPAADWAALVRAASPHQGPWPRVSVWQGDADTTVRPANAEQILRQWAALHGTSGTPEESGSGARRSMVWRGRDGAVVLEHHAIAGMSHGVPVDPAVLGQAGPYFLPVGVASTLEIAGFFGLPVTVPAAATAGRASTIDQDGNPVPKAETEADDGFALGGIKLTSIDPGGVIRKALTAAGLIKS
ncbi:alpha/beta hydrolase family esterase [Paeniroseomonas aquatica]|uniref:PHB depolymerase family esterase n=1 Tax=Paeniroseomonas aquatica TaxID=373043 RepID=A0ABT8A973_9PROT|nr:PHB depolymerase family esterase [Paeniroseomonas aquatica]MDN3566322.1 PHB depolymerase family esterase [Paeniroseomonas aquatica]